MLNILNIIYALISVLAAVSLGIFFIRRGKIVDNFDYLLAILGGIFWPLTICVILLNIMLENFKKLCVCINDQIDKIEAYKSKKP